MLVVDDDPLVLASTAAMLEDLRHKAIEAASGQEALDILRNGAAVDLVVTDQAMPGLTGVQLSGIIRQSWPNLPVLLATGYADLSPVDATNFPRLHKPFSVERLGQAIADCLDQQKHKVKVLPFRPKLGSE